MNNRGWTLHFGLVVLVIIGILTLIFGWKTLIYVAGLFVAITFFVWMYDVFTGAHQEDQIEETDAPVVPEVNDEESMPAVSPALEEGPPQGHASAAAEFLGIVVFFGAILACLFLPSIALGMWGPWAGIGVSLACGGLWIAFGPAAFPGLLPGCLAIVIPGNALVITLISLYRLIWH